MNIVRNLCGQQTHEMISSLVSNQGKAKIKQ